MASRHQLMFLERENLIIQGPRYKGQGGGGGGGAQCDKEADFKSNILLYQRVFIITF